MLSFLSPFSCPSPRESRRRHNAVGSWLAVAPPKSRQQTLTRVRPSGWLAVASDEKVITTPRSVDEETTRNSGGWGPHKSGAAPRDLSMTEPVTAPEQKRASVRGGAYQEVPQEKLSAKAEMLKILKAGRAGKSANRKMVLSDLDAKGDAIHTRGSSRYRSCLLPKGARPMPVQTAQSTVQDNLKTDAMHFNWKYSGPAAQPNRHGLHPASTYSIVMPDSPVHAKFSNTEVGSPGLDLNKKRPKFSVATLRRWFTSMDADGSGSIGRREMLLAMRSQKELKHIFSEAVSNRGVPSGAGNKLVGLQGNPAQHGDADRMLRAELQHIMEILQEVDSDGSGTLEWDEVLEFFRRSGYLLEYATKPELNDPDKVDSSAEDSDDDWDAY